MTFVHDLALDHDPRLAALRPPHAHASLEARRDAAPPPPAPTAIDDTLRAAVNGASLVSFVGGLSVEQKSDVLYSTQLAQRAASARFDRIGATKDWYGVYVEVLERLGWVGEAFAFTERGSEAGDFSLDRSALEVIQAIATGNQLAVLVKTLDVVKKLGGEDRAIRIFELRALAEASGNFQIGAAQPAENGVVALALGAFHFTADDRRTQVLFAKWGAAHIRLWTAVRKMSLNSEFYAPHRQAVRQKIEADAADYIAGLAI